MSTLEKYIYEDIVPRYAGFDSAHREDHALTVINQAKKLLDSREEWLKAHHTKPEDGSMEWAQPVEWSILLAAAACHDLGLVNGRERHHLDSGRIIRNDSRLKEWFSDDEIETIAQAAEDHRASGKSEPRSIYGKLVAEADRVINGETIIVRTVQFGLNNYPCLDEDGHMERAVSHLREKYGKGGYLKLWIPWSDNAVRLAALQDIIADEKAVYQEVRRIYRSLHELNGTGTK
jgi:uncharacterized protein